MSKFKKVVNYTREDAWFQRKAWVTPKLIVLGILAVGAQESGWALFFFVFLGMWWSVKLLTGLLTGKYTGIR